MLLKFPQNTDGSGAYIYPGGIENYSVSHFVEIDGQPAIVADWASLAPTPPGTDFFTGDISELLNAAKPPLIISTTRLKSELLGAEVYGGLRVARAGLNSKFSANNASVEEVGQLTLLEAADGMTAAPEIDLHDPAVEQVLNFAVANLFIGYGPRDDEGKPERPFDDQHKARVLANIALSEVIE